MLSISSSFRWLSLGLVALTLTVSCNQQPQTNTPTNPTVSRSPAPDRSQSLLSATNNWIGHSGHYVAVKKGLFAEAGVKVEDLFFQSSSEMLSAFMAGKADIAWLTTGDAVQAAEKDPSIKIIYLIDYSNGADGILGRNIKSPQNIKGKTVARENILFEKVLLQAYLNKAGLTEKDVKIKDMVAADAATAFGAKQVDAAVTFEPYLTKAAKQGGGEVIFSTKDTNLIADAIVVRDKLIQTRKADLQKYLTAVDKAVKLVNAGNPEAIGIAANKMGVSVEEVKAQLAGAKLFDLDGNRNIAFNKNNPNNVIGNLELTAKAATDFKVVAKPINPKTLYDASLVEAK